MERLGEYFRKFVLCHEYKYKWLGESLAQLNIRINTLADFGCGEGWETLALMCLLNANQGTGVDKNHSDIVNAQGALGHIQNIIWARGVASNTPSFLNNPNLEDVLEFLPGDIRRLTQLATEYYDLAFCNRVLYLIWLNQGGKPEVQNAIVEMARVVKPDGIVAAFEPNMSNGLKLDFGTLFECVGLRMVPVDFVDVAEQHTAYLFAK